MSDAEVVLDICTPEGRTWLARITGPDPQHRVARDFLRADDWATSRSGRTGSATYLLGPGIYERHEGRRRLRGNNGFFRITTAGEVVQLESARAALAALAGQPAGQEAAQ